MCQQDSFQEHYTQTGRYPGPTVTTPRRPWALINWLFWACLLLYPLGLLFAQLISSGSLLTILASVALCFAGWFHAFMPKVKSPWNGCRSPSLILTSSFLSKCSIKQQIWQLKCKSAFFLENMIHQSWEHVPKSIQACAFLAKLTLTHLSTCSLTEMLNGEIISLAACRRLKWQILFSWMLSAQSQAFI